MHTIILKERRFVRPCNIITPELTTKTHSNDGKKPIRIEGETSEAFMVTSGVRQGDPLYTVLFNIILEKIIRDSRVHTAGTIHHHKHQILAYADNITDISRTKEELIKVFKQIEVAAMESGLRVNETKTKYMVMSDERRNNNSPLCINKPYENVQLFCYLGVILMNNNDDNKELQE